MTRWEESGGCGMSLSVTLPYMGWRGQEVSAIASMPGGREWGYGFTCCKGAAFGGAGRVSEAMCV